MGLQLLVGVVMVALFAAVQSTASLLRHTRLRRVSAALLACVPAGAGAGGLHASAAGSGYLPAPSGTSYGTRQEADSFGGGSAPEPQAKAGALSISVGTDEGPALVRRSGREATAPPLASCLVACVVCSPCKPVPTCWGCGNLCVRGGVGHARCPSEHRPCSHFRACGCGCGGGVFASHVGVGPPVTGTQREPQAEDATRMPLRARCFGAAANFCLTAYASFTIACVRMLHCVTVPGAHSPRLFIRGTVACDASGWQLPFAVVGAVLVAAPLLLPLAAAWASRPCVSSSGRPDSALWVDVRMGVRRALVGAYTPAHHWWEAVLMVQRLVRGRRERERGCTA
jgi:hypothetical protein